MLCSGRSGESRVLLLRCEYDDGCDDRVSGSTKVSRMLWPRVWSFLRWSTVNNQSIQTYE